MSETVQNYSSGQLFSNLSDEIAFSLDLAVNVEEVVSDLVASESAKSSFAKTELQNSDRLIQVLSDFKVLTEKLSVVVPDQEVDKKEIRALMTMTDLADRLTSDFSTRSRNEGSPDTSVTFF